MLLQAVAGIDLAVAEKSHDAVGMHEGLSVLVASDAAVEGGNLHFLVQPHRLEGFLRAVGPADDRRTEGADGRKMGVRQVVLLREIHQASYHIIAFGEQDLEGPRPRGKFSGLQPGGGPGMYGRGRNIFEGGPICRPGGTRQSSGQNQGRKIGSHHITPRLVWRNTA